MIFLYECENRRTTPHFLFCSFLKNLTESDGNTLPITLKSIKVTMAFILNINKNLPGVATILEFGKEM